MAVTASFSAQTGVLSIVGDNADNVINISRAADGTILINNGEVAIVGGPATVNNTTTILGLGLDGNDQITLNEFNGALPRAFLLGSSGNDLLIGGSGQDTVLGGSGNDTIRGGDNADQIFGGSGNDVLLGDRGNDNVNGGAGNDLLIWNNGDGSDTMEGGDGNDFVQLNGANGAGDDISIDPNGDRIRVQRNNLGLFTLDIGTVENLDINGQGGNDVIVGSVGLNGLISLDLDGGEGNDLLIGGDGIDVLRGGAGNDTLLGRQGNDVVLGEDGSDLLIVNNGDGSDFLEGGSGTDTVQVNGADGAGDDFSISPNGNRVRFQRNNLGLFTLDIGTVENLDVNGGGGNDIIVGSVGLAGLISLDLDGGEGNDLLIGGDGADVLRGGAGNDTLLGNRGNDIVLGQDGNDLLIWNNGDGSDFLEGGEDIDTVQINGANDAGDDIRIDPNGERVRVRRNNLEQFVLDIGTTENLDINGQGGNDIIIGSVGLNGLISLDLDGGEGNDLLIGGDGADVLRGGAGNDTLLGGRGNDIMLGQDGNDLLIWNNDDGSDFMEGGDGLDTVQVNGANGAGDSFQIDPNGERVRFRRTNLGLFTLDIGTTENLDVNGQGGSDVIIASNGLAGLIQLDLDGGEGNDLIIGGDGADVIRGGAGNDTLLGRTGNDIILGEDGNDLIIHNNGDGSDFVEGGDDNDTLQVNGSNTSGDMVMVTPNGNRVQVQGTYPNQFTLDIGTIETLDVNLLAGNDRFTGSNGLAGLISLDIDGGLGNDIVTGGDGGDTIKGGGDNDLLRGRDGNDTLIGGTGNDFVFGENGNDLMVWNFGDGNDLTFGGAGRDTFQMTFSNLDDEIDLSASGNFLRIEQVNQTPSVQTVGSTEVIDIRTGDGDDEVTVNDLSGVPDLETVIIDGEEGDDIVNATDLQAGIALIARGGDGNDIMFGGDGNDVMIGEDGRDIIIANDGNDFVSGGEGNDILISGNGNDVVLGGDGNDVLSGGNGNDILLAGDGNDVINGGAGTDFIDGGAGFDSAINGETVINVENVSLASAAPAEFSLSAFLRGEVTVRYDAKLHGVDTFANFNPGEDKIIVAGFDQAMMARTEAGFMRQNADSFVRLVDDGKNTKIQFDADGAGNGHGFQDQWILEDFSGRDLNDLVDDILFA